MSPRAWLLFIVSSVIWACRTCPSKISVDGGVPPRSWPGRVFALAAVLLLPLAWSRGALRGVSNRKLAIVGYATCEVTVPFVLMRRELADSWGAACVARDPGGVHAADDRAGVAATPARGRPTGVGLIGLFLGSSVWSRCSGLTSPGGLAVLSARCWCWSRRWAMPSRRSSSFSRWLADLDPLGPIAASLALAAIVLLPAALAASHPATARHRGPRVHRRVLGVICTCGRPDQIYLG